MGGDRECGDCFIFSQGEARSSLLCLSVSQEIFIQRVAFMKGVESLSVRRDNVSVIRDVITKMASGGQSKEVRHRRTGVALLPRSGMLTE